MTLKKWAYLAEIGSAIAVVLSLLYVAYELNQNTNAVRAGNWQALLDYSAEADMLVLANADVANVLERAESDYDGLTKEDKRRFAMYAINTFNYWEAAYLHHRQGLLDAVAWETIDRGTRSFLEYETYRGYWERNNDIWTPDFVAHIDGIIEQGGYR